MTQTRQNYQQRYPTRAKIQNLAVALSLAFLLFPFFPRLSISIAIDASEAQAGIDRGSGR